MEIYLLPQVAESDYGAGRFCTVAQSAVCGHVVESVENATMLAELKTKNWEYQVCSVT